MQALLGAYSERRLVQQSTLSIVDFVQRLAPKAFATVCDVLDILRPTQSDNIVFRTLDIACDVRKLRERRKKKRGNSQR